MDRRLTAQECAHLKKCHKKERDKRICDRIKAVLLYDKGYSYTKVAEIRLLDDETIRRHVKTYFSRNKLKPENGGSEGYLTQAETIALKAHLFEKTYLYVKDICVYVEKNFKKSYSISGMTKWLRKHNFRYLIWDNAGYHRSKEIQSFIANTKITLHFLPPYSPNLNPIERLWKIMHEQVTYNRYYPKFLDFTEGILNFFENIERHKTTMLSRITDNFQRLVFT